MAMTSHERIGPQEVRLIVGLWFAADAAGRRRGGSWRSAAAGA